MWKLPNARAFSELIKIYRDLDREYVSASKWGIGVNRDGETYKSKMRDQLTTVLVNHLSLFNHPTSATSLMSCPEIKRINRLLDPTGRETDRILQILVQRGFVSHYHKYSRANLGLVAEPLSVMKREKSKKKSRAIDQFVFAIDTKISMAVRSEMRLSTFVFNQSAPFQPSLFPSQQSSEVNPEVRHYNMVKGIIFELIDQSHVELLKLKNGSSQHSATIEPLQRLEFFEEVS